LRRVWAVFMKVNRRFGVTCLLHLQGRRINQARNQHGSGRKQSCWRCRRHVPPKRRFTFNGLHCVMPHMTELFTVILFPLINLGFPSDNFLSDFHSQMCVFLMPSMRFTFPAHRILFSWSPQQYLAKNILYFIGFSQHVSAFIRPSSGKNLYTFSQATIPLANVYILPYAISTEACQVESHMQN
jgi:hypothetical protein